LRQPSNCLETFQVWISRVRIALNFFGISKAIASLSSSPSGVPFFIQSKSGQEIIVFAIIKILSLIPSIKW
jgi:hypothetical protein